MLFNKLELENFEAKRKEFLALNKNGADESQIEASYIESMEALYGDFKANIDKEVDNKIEAIGKHTSKGLTGEAVKFYNEINTEVGFKDESLLPETTIDKIFEDMIEERPILKLIGLKTIGLRMRILKSETSGQGVWGAIFGAITGQLDATFSEEEMTQSKLTAFVVIPNDLREYGPSYVERFVRLQITEVFAYMVEAAIVAGDGNDKPIGLNRQVQEGVSVSGGVYPEKAVSGTLTFGDSVTTVNELTGVMKALSVKENGKAANIDGKVVLLVNPSNAWEVQAQHTTQNVNGVYVTSMPFNIEVISSEFVTVDTVIAFVKGRYDAYVGGGINIKQYNETLALEDCTLYTAKQFAYGKAHDDNAAKVYTLAIPPIA